jgi:hypothetical protein
MSYIEESNARIAWALHMLARNSDLCLLAISIARASIAALRREAGLD